MEHVIELFVAHHCPSCPDARGRVREFANKYPNVTLIERNVDEALGAAEAYGLFATPAIVIDRRSIFYGVPTIAQLATRCKVIEGAPRDTERPEMPRQRQASGAGLTTSP
jgi:thiol-disulfide isomerase/thioredoxin